MRISSSLLARKPTELLQLYGSQTGLLGCDSLQYRGVRSDPFLSKLNAEFPWGSWKRRDLLEALTRVGLRAS